MSQLIAIVVPIYNEIDCLPLLYQAYLNLFEAHPHYGWQVVFVDDGSQDGSLAWMRQLSQKDARVTCVELARNFGHQLAISAGLSQVQSADAVVLMDGDMQDPPEVIAQMLSAYEAGAEVVLAKRLARAGRGWRRWGNWFFHRCLLKTIDIDLASEVGVFSLMSRAVVAHLNRMPEHDRYLPALRHWLGFARAEVTYKRAERVAGEPKQRWRHLLQEATHCIFSFSDLPIRLITHVGMFATVFGFAMAVFYIAKRIFFHDPAVTGFTTLLTMVVFFGGIQLLSLGVMGQYIARIHLQSRGRPLFIIREVHQQNVVNDQAQGVGDA